MCELNFELVHVECELSQHCTYCTSKNPTEYKWRFIKCSEKCGHWLGILAL